MSAAIDDLREVWREECWACRRHWSVCDCSEDPDLARQVALARAMRDSDDSSALELLGVSS
jgi:hypothetical protein